MSESRIPYGRHQVEEEDIQAVIDALRSDWLTTGPLVEEFEKAIAGFCNVKYAVALSSGTAALHTAMHALGISPGDEVIVPPMTFAATANAVVYQGGTPVFADVRPDTLLLDPASVETKISKKTKAIVAVDYAGQPADYDALRDISNRHRLRLVADACHSLGATYKGRPCGGLADLSIFSFHPVKPITTAEGGMLVTDDPLLKEKALRFRNHGISTDHRQRAKSGAWFYEMVELGFNYRLTDLQCSLGITQLKRLPRWIARRQQIAAGYDAAFDHSTIRPLQAKPDISHGYHLYVVRVPNRDAVFSAMRAKGIGVNVHYVPVHLHPYYRQTFSTGENTCPVAEKAFEEILSLPVFPGMTDRQVHMTIEAIRQCVAENPL